MTETIIFCHTGRQPYVKLALAQARRTNPNARVVLLGSTENRDLSSHAEHRLLSDFDRSASLFRDKYVHLSRSGVVFERFCIERHLIISDFCRAEGIDHFLHADSDTLIFAEIGDARRRFKDFAFTLSCGSSGHACFWNSREALQAFVDYVMTTYEFSDAARTRRLMDFYRPFPANGRPGGVCDMTLLQFFAHDSGFRVGDTSEIAEGRTFDHNINMSANGRYEYAMVGEIKKVEWHDGLPHVALRDSSDLVRFDVLHCQGRSKRYIESLAGGVTPSRWRATRKSSILKEARRSARDLLKGLVAPPGR